METTESTDSTRLDSSPVWYVAYGSNLLADRFDCYVAGGRPPGGLREYPGFRDPTPPLASVTETVRGGIYFAGESHAWTGGTAFFDSGLPGVVAARAYLIGRAQFGDLAEQEMLRTPATDRDLSVVLADGRHSYGPGRYESLIRLGERDGLAMLTISAPWAWTDAPLAPPNADYLRIIARGLVESHGWDDDAVAAYLAAAPGIVGEWEMPQIRALLA